MIATQPEIHLRIGSHAEKEYFEKMVKRFDGLTVGANLVEVTPGATASLLVKLCSDSKGVPYLIDPMTYAFGSYVDPATGQSRTDLDWIKSDQKVKGQKGKSVRKVKSSYQKLAEAFGTVFLSACNRGRAVDPDDLKESSIRTQSDPRRFLGRPGLPGFCRQGAGSDGFVGSVFLHRTIEGDRMDRD
jgi:hypothetical protein